MRISTRVIVAALTAVCALGAAKEDAAAQQSDRRPNIILIVVDDLRWDELGVTGHPYVQTPNVDRLAREGAQYTNAFHAVPLCSPNRASIFTGQYPSRHGIIDNVARSLASFGLRTFPQALQTSGYETAFVGKWHMGNDPTPRRGFDYWAALPGQGRSIDPELYEDGRLHVVSGYTTDILTDRAVSFIADERDEPFFLYLGHKAIHPDIAQLDDGSVDLSTPARYVPAPRHVGRYDGALFPEPPNAVASPADLEGKPALQRALERKNSPQMLEALGARMFDYRPNQDIIRTRAEMLLAVDESLGRIVETLDELGQLDDTAIFFTSDNGYWFGEHGLSNERRLPYEEAIRMPLFVRYPPIAEAGDRIDLLVSSVDIAPTILDIAGAPISQQIEGLSTLPLLRGRAGDWRDAVLIEFFTYENPMPWLVDMDYRAVRSDRYKYIHWVQYPEEGELYDLLADPGETTNLYDDERHADALADMQGKLEREIVRALGL